MPGVRRTVDDAREAVLLGLQGVDLALQVGELRTGDLLLLVQAIRLGVDLVLPGGHLLILLLAQGLVGLQRSQVGQAGVEQLLSLDVFGFEADAVALTGERASPLAPTPPCP